MKIRSAKAFRTWYKIHYKRIKPDDPDHDECFMGTYHDVSAEQRIKGFFEMYHGHKEDIASYLPSILKIAEDGQAIYEFLQNAVDCDSTECHIFYDDRFFLALNNGRSFSTDEIYSLLNIAQSPKKNPKQIGRLGVGFKLVHRLVGRGDGTSELVNDYKGPVLFSWSAPKDLRSFLNAEKTEYSEDVCNDGIPCLFKILLTNFPADVGETVKDISYRERIVFDSGELSDMRRFMCEAFSGLHSDINKRFKHGSAFFLELGEGKKQLLDKDYHDLENGIQFSMNILKKLTRVCINKRDIKRFPLQTELFTIEPGSELFTKIGPEYKEYPVHIAFGYSPDFAKSGQLKSSPNFYKYFPMGDENNGFSFMVHCDSFSNEVNRRKLQHDSLNQNLLPEIAEMLIGKMIGYRTQAPSRFLEIYGNLLLSDVPNKQNNVWLRPVFYDRLGEYLRKNIPVEGGFYECDPQSVKIKDLKIDLNLGEVGLSAYKWFYWNASDKNIVAHATDPEKLGLQKWDIRDIVEQADLESLNLWIATRSETEYKTFLYELNRSELRKPTQSRLAEIALFKFSDHKFYSVRQQRDDILFHTGPRTYEIKDVLEDLGFITTCIDISSYPHLYEAVENICFPSESDFFDTLSQKCSVSELSAEQKKKLIRNLTDKDYWSDIYEELPSLCLFLDQSGRKRPIKSLLPLSAVVPKWLNKYKIEEKEYEECLDKLLMDPRNIYTEIILPNQEEIFSEISNPESFYKSITKFYNEEEDAPLLNETKIIYVNPQKGFVKRDDVYFHPVLSQITRLSDIESAVSKLTGLNIPHNKILKYMDKEPFSVPSSLLSEWELDEEEVLSKEEIVGILELCALTKDRFFDEYIITRRKKGYGVIRRTEETCQIWINNKKNSTFYETHFRNLFYMLPREFGKYVNTVGGILQEQKLDEAVVSMLDAEANKESLVRNLSFEEAKKRFFEKLRCFKLDAHKKYGPDDWEYILLDWACQLSKDKNLIDNFRSKITIKVGEEEYRLTEIPCVEDQITIGDTKLNLSRIFPKSFEKVQYINAISENFSSLGSRVNTVLGMEEQKDLRFYFNHLWEDELDAVDEYPDERIVMNTEQLVFLLLYHRWGKTLDLSEINILTNDFVWSLDTSFFLKKYDFLDPERVVDLERYKNIDLYKDILLEDKWGNLRFYEGPLNDEGNVICDAITDGLDDQQRTALIEFLDSALLSGRKIGWPNDAEKKKILGFDPERAVYITDSKLRCKDEVLPDYLTTWLASSSEHKRLLPVLGIASDENLLLLRKSLLTDELPEKPDLSEIPVPLLENTLRWLYEHRVPIDEERKCALFNDLLGRLNCGEKCYDVDALFAESRELAGRNYEQWKEHNRCAFFLHDGPIVTRTCVEKFGGYTFCEEECGAALINGNILFVNSEADVFKELQHLVDDRKMNLNITELYGVYASDSTMLDMNENLRRLMREINKIPAGERDNVVENMIRGVACRHEPNAVKGYDLNSGESAEQLVLERLIERFGKKRVKWTSSKNPANGPYENSTDEYDFEVYSKDLKSIMYYIDCKSTTAGKYSGSTKIYWTEAEWRFIEEQKPSNYLIARVFDCNSDCRETTFLRLSFFDLVNDPETE